MRKVKQRKSKIKNIVIILIIIIIIILIALFVYINYQKKVDVYKNTNLLLGTWIYNEFNGTYIFEDDYTYVQYTNEDKTNNYCMGKYKYSYGATDDKGLTIRQDDNYYYYELSLNIEECYIMNKISNDNYTKKMFFGIKKNNNDNDNNNNNDEILFINAETENILILNKVKE